MEECQNCKIYEKAINDLLIELESLRRRRRDIFKTIRLLKKEVIRNMESEYAISQPDGYAGEVFGQ